MNIVVINGLGNSSARRCIDSLLETAAGSDFDLYLFRERGFREQTLNAALRTVGVERDILFVGDDILLPRGGSRPWLRTIRPAIFSAWYALPGDGHGPGLWLRPGRRGRAHISRPRDRGRRMADLNPLGCDPVMPCADVSFWSNGRVLAGWPNSAKRAKPLGRIHIHGAGSPCRIQPCGN
ncbi:MAG: hypothetical protein R2864_03845 [Syntrophotaleaceae bacterium]